MSIKILATMPLKPLSRISPSRYSAMRACALREIWAAGGQPPLLPISPSAHLGMIAHKLLELALSAKLADENAMQACWEEEIQKHEQKMGNNPLEKHLIPLASHADNYRVKQIMTYNMVRSLLKGVTGQPVKTRTSSVEKWVQTSEGKIGGKIDLVRHTDEGISIIDYKTGVIVVSDQNGDFIKEDYQIQMKLYAALYYSSYGIWPDKLVLVGFNQYEYDIPIDREECLTLLKNAVSYLDKLNKRIEAGSEVDAFAVPTPETCRFCTYRPACKMYWTTTVNNEQWPADFEGVIVEKKVQGNGLLKIVVENEQKKITIRGLSSERYPFLYKDIQKVMFCNLGKDSVKDHFKETHMTTGYSFYEECL